MATVLPIARRVRTDRSVAMIVGASLFAMTSAFAADEAQKPQEPPELAEVVVSVERVTQTLQSYAGTAVTATQAELDSLGATNLVDIPSVLPGVEISNYEDNTNIYVRGIGSDANTELGDPAVAPHLDDVYVPRPRGLQVAFFDIDRVEVNVGPQGTVRGRNALGGTVNIVSKKPEMNKFDGYAQVGVGNYNEKEYRGALNVPLANDIAAARLSIYSSTHDPFVKNVGPLRTLTGWESQDDLGARMHVLVQPLEQWSFLVTGDYLRSRGTGSRGVDFFNAANAGINFNDVSDPRRVNMVAFDPTQDTRHWGLSLNTTYKTDLLNVQYIGAYRSLHYQSDHPSNGRDYAFPGDDNANIERGGFVHPGDPLAAQYLSERVYGNYSALIWDTTSKMHTHELRFTSPDSASRITWAAGLYYFKEHQDVFLGIPQDYNTLPYLEFNQGSTNGESKSGYGDLTFAVTDKWKVTAGARYSKESKDRDGFNFIAGLDTNGVAIRTGTPGFSMAGLARALRNPDADGDGVPNQLADIVALYRAGVTSYGINDTLNTFLSGGCVQASAFGGTCANYPGLKLAFGGATVQHGSNSDKFVDWRARTQYEFTDKNMAYALVALGHKAPSFNDSVQAGDKLITPPVGPEKSIMVEVGSKNILQVADHPLVLNASAYYVKYTDQVFSSQVAIAFLANDPVGEANCRSNNPNIPCPTVTLNQNVGKSRNIGFQLDSAYSLGYGLALAGTVLYQNTRYENGSLVTDGRRAGPTGTAPVIDLGGNELPRSPPLTLNMRLNQAFAVPGGMADWVISGTYKTRQYLTAFNGGPGNNSARDVIAVDARNRATAYGAEELRLFDKVNGYFHMDLGLGYTHEASNARVELYVNNVTDEAHATQTSIDTRTQELIFNPPRTYGVRMQVSF